MSLTRDAIQGFIDGYNKAGGKDVQTDITDWMDKHPLYALTESEKAVVLSDLESYRGIVKQAPVEVTPI